MARSRETSIHDHMPGQAFQNPVLNPEHVQHEHGRVSLAPPPLGGGHDDSSSSSSSDDDAEKRKKKRKRGPYKVKCVEMPPSVRFPQPSQHARGVRRGSGRGVARQGSPKVFNLLHVSLYTSDYFWLKLEFLGFRV